MPRVSSSSQTRARLTKPRRPFRLILQTKESGRKLRWATFFLFLALLLARWIQTTTLTSLWIEWMAFLPWAWLVFAGMILLVLSWIAKKIGLMMLQILLILLGIQWLWGGFFSHWSTEKSGITLTVMSQTLSVGTSIETLAELAAREGVQVLMIQGANALSAIEEKQLQALFPRWTLLRSGDLITLTPLAILEEQKLNDHSLLAQVRIDGEAVQVLNTSLTSVWPAAQSWNTTGITQQADTVFTQRKDLQKTVASLSKESVMVVSSQLNAPIPGHLRHAFHQQGLQEIKTGFTFPAPIPYAQLNGVWVSGAVNARGFVLSEWLGFHRGVVARVWIKSTH